MAVSDTDVTRYATAVDRQEPAARSGMAVLTAVMLASPPVWWTMQLIRLPDIGDPFDVAAFRRFTIPDERTVCALRTGGRAVKAMAAEAKARWWTDRLACLVDQAAPEVRQWADSNREALSLYRHGSELPDALGAVPKFVGDHEEHWDMFGPLQQFELLALLEGSRLQEQGDMAGAWGWYREVLRTIHHVGMHGTVSRRAIVQRWHMQLSERLAGWSADRRTTPAVLRQAVDDVVACESLAPFGIVHAQSRIPRRGPAAR